MDLSKNYKGLQGNPYSGRGIIVGLGKKGGCILQVYWIMGRSPNSRNRVLEADAPSGRLWSAPADPGKVTDPSLTIYNAMRECGNPFAGFHHIVGNGRQTDIADDASFVEQYGILGALRVSKWIYEPDPPHHTPRITADCFIKDEAVQGIEMVLQRKSAWDTTCESFLYRYRALPAGVGMCVHTYMGDGDPLPAFRGEPYPMPLGPTAETTLEMYWRALNPAHRVSVAVKSIDISSGESHIVIRNQYQQVQDTRRLVSAVMCDND